MNHVSKGLVLVAVCALLMGAGLSGAKSADSYSVDNAHSSIVFSVNHNGLSDVYGVFNSFSGSFVLDSENLDNSSVELTIDAASVDTAVAARDEHLNSPDFFNTAQFPEITFRSTAIEQLSDDTYKVTGDFTLHGVTKSIDIEVVHNGVGTGRNGEARTGFSASFSILRSEFGMTYGLPNIGDEVSVMASFQGMGEAPAAAEAN